jgi:hypothetical protein
MVKARKDLTNKVFGKLTVIKQIDDHISLNGQHKSRWRCRCECGNIVDVTGGNLTSGNTKSCGCLQKERVILSHKKYNDYEIQEDYVIMYTSKGEPFYIDLEDFWKVKNICWNQSDTGYIISDINNKRTRLHRFIMNCPDGMDVDHINHNKLDNRKNNLRIVTRSQNHMNKPVRSDNTTSVTGVWWFKERNKWTSEITINRKKIHLGCFDNFGDAVKVRKQAEEKYFGEYSYDNSQKIGGYNEVSTDRN